VLSSNWQRSHSPSRVYNVCRNIQSEWGRVNNAVGIEGLQFNQPAEYPAGFPHYQQPGDRMQTFSSHPEANVPTATSAADCLFRVLNLQTAFQTLRLNEPLYMSSESTGRSAE